MDRQLEKRLWEKRTEKPLDFEGEDDDEDESSEALMGEGG